MAILVGVAATAVVLGNRGGEDLFRMQQARALGGTQARVLSAGRVEAVVALAPEPVPAARRTGRAALAPAWMGPSNFGA
jgi:hypothetical protein